MQRAGCAGGAVRIEPDHARVVAALADRRAPDRDHGRATGPTVGSGRRLVSVLVLVLVLMLVWPLIVWLSWHSPGTLNDRFGNSLVARSWWRPPTPFQSDLRLCGNCGWQPWICSRHGKASFSGDGTNTKHNFFCRGRRYLGLFRAPMLALPVIVTT